MANTRNYLRSFAGGEISPEMFGRIDDVRYQTGAATVRNFISKPQGPAQNRPGFQFVREVKDSTKQVRLIPFQFSVAQTYVIELGDGYFRIHSDGGTIVNPPSDPFFAQSEATPGVLPIVGSDLSGDLLLTAVGHGLSNEDPIFIYGGGYPSSTVIHYVRDATADTFKVETSIGTTPIAWAGFSPTSAAFVYYEDDFVQLGTTVYRKNDVYPGSQDYWSSDLGTPATNSAYWVNAGSVNQPYEVSTVYSEADLFGINYVQSNDVLTLVHPNYPPAEIRRYGDQDWRYVAINFQPSLAAPNGLSSTPFRGRRMRIERIETLAGPTKFRRKTSSNGFYVSRGDPIYLSDLEYTNGDPSGIADDFYQVSEVANDLSWFTLQTVETGATVNAIPPSGQSNGIYDAVGYIQYAEKTEDYNSYYKVTAIGEGDIQESAPSDEHPVGNNLFASGAYNELEWSPVPGAVRYNVYKKQNSLYGYIGQTDTPDFVDDNIAPDMAITPPEYDSVFGGAGDYPASVAYFEQRRVFGGTNNEPQNIWMTKSGTESDFSYQLPIRDADRISFQIASRELNQIRHIVPITELILLTDAAEWRVTSVNSDAITPSSIAVRPQSYIGSNAVRPSVVNNTMIYCAARGGHVRELGYSDAARGFVTNDVSLRAAHLFDNLTIKDQTYTKSPTPIVWFVSSSGKLLGLTYIPEQQIGAWHQHDTQDGAFESVCSIAEGDEDAIYVVVRRADKSGGGHKRYVERMATRTFAELPDAFFVDSGLSYDGTNTSSTTVTVTGGTSWGPSEDLTLTSSADLFVGATDIGDVVELDGSDGTIYRLEIVAYVSATEVTVRTDKVIPEDLRSTATTSWALCRNEFLGLDHLEGYEVAILADGSSRTRQTVASGKITLGRAFRKVHVGIPITSDLKTLPITLQIDGFAQGRHKNVNKVWLRVFRSSDVMVGPDEDHLTPYKQRTSEPYGSPPSLISEQIEVLISPSWAEDGQVVIRQDEPLPLTISGLTVQVVLGG